MKAKEGYELTLQSKDGNEYRRNSSFVKPYQPVQGSTTPEHMIMIFIHLVFGYVIN